MGSSKFLQKIKNNVKGFSISCIYIYRYESVRQEEIQEMDERIQMRVQEINRRVKIKQHRYRRRLYSRLSAMSMMILAGISLLLQNVQTLGIAEVPEAYGSVLLRNEVSAYIVVGIGAFAAGAALTIICIQYHKKQREKDERTERKEQAEELCKWEERI